MARAIPRQTRTPADELRGLLEHSARVAVNSRLATPEELRQLLHDLDRIQALFPELEALGVDLRPERGRWQEVQGAVRRHSDDLLAGLRPLGGLAALRQELPAPPDAQTRWWWWLDARRARQKRRRLLVAAGLFIGLLLVLVGGWLALQALLPVDDAVVTAYEHKLNAEDFVLRGQYEEAVLELEAARELTPDDPDILALLAALYDLTGQPEQAAALQDQLDARYPPSIVHSNLAQAYLAAGAVDKALDLALQAIAEDDANPQGYLIAASAYEAKGETRQAMAFYQQAAEKANAAGDHQTEAFAKVRLATLLQKPQISPTP